MNYQKVILLPDIFTDRNGSDSGFDDDDSEE